MNNFPLVVSATIAMYVDCAVKAAQGLKKNWLLLVASVLAYLVFQFAAQLLFPFGMAGGMILGLVEIAFLTMYYSWIARTIQREKLKAHNFKEFDTSMFFSLISVSFIIWMVEYVVGLSAIPSGNSMMVSFVRLGIVILFNALPEVIYINRMESIPALQESASFTIRNWIEWYLPFALIIFPWLLSSLDVVSLVLSQTHPLLPVLMVVTSPALLLRASSEIAALGVTLLGVALANWFMLFRGHLFMALQSGSRRQRVFVARQRQ